MKSSSTHRDTIFAGTEDPKLGWYEKDASQTFELLNKIPNWENSTISLSGAGTSVLIDELLCKSVKLVLKDKSKNNTCINPSGDPRRYIYTLHKRVSGQ